ncbi:hypothetical protein B4U79_15878 [Dinothrombium tinctorium]|uniref:Uncharacterized protein n=1 Tax=Dinothrombium tinctorium TaxID=1965070 RepID=A0A443RAS6_9ACAR|nr:hypothetical protein B4U79_15878 [Dinothrombium tinctorium]
MSREDPVFLSLKWSIVIITLVNIVYTLYIFFLYFKNTSRERSVRLIIWTIAGVLFFSLGLIGAFKEDFTLMLIFGIVLILNLILGFFQTEIYKGSLLLYVILIVLTFIFAYFVHKKYN